MLSSLPPTPTLTHRENSRQTNTVFDSFCLKPTRKKKNKRRRRRKNCTVVRKQGVRLRHTEETKGITLCQIKKNYASGCAVQAKRIHFSFTEYTPPLFCGYCFAILPVGNTTSKDTFAYSNITSFFKCIVWTSLYSFVVLKSNFCAIRALQVKMGSGTLNLLVRCGM